MLKHCPICGNVIEKLKQVCCSQECAGKFKRNKLTTYRIFQKTNGKKWAQKMHEAKRIKKLSRS